MLVHIKPLGTARRIADGTVIKTHADACNRMNEYFVYIYLMIAENGLIFHACPPCLS